MAFGSRRHQKLSGAFISAIGLLLASIIVYDIYADVVFDNNTLFSTLIENVLPLSFDLIILGTGYWILGNDKSDIAQQTMVWTAVSVVGILLMALWAYQIQFRQGQFKPIVFLAQIGSMGALAGVIVGIYSGRQKLRQRQFQSLFQNSSDCVAEIRFDDGTPRIRDINPAFEDTFGYQLNDIEGRSIDDLIVPRETIEEAKEFSEAGRNGEKLETEVERITAPGKKKTFRLQVVPVEPGEDARSGYAVYTDITQSKQYTKRVNALHSATRELISAATPENVAREGVSAVSDILGLSISTIFFASNGVLEPVASTDSAQELFTEIEVLEEGEAAAWQVFESGQPMRIANVQQLESIQNPNTPIVAEMILPLNGYGVLLIGDTEEGEFDDEDFTLAKILANNITTALDRVEHEQAIREREQELREQNERLETFTSIVSHDLRSPLSVADGYIELAEEKVGDVDELDCAAEALDRMDSLIDELLTLSQQGDIIDEMSVIDLEAVASSAWATADTEQATLTIEKGFQFKGDQSRIRQLLENLFRNAVDHGGSDVSVTVGGLNETSFFVEDTGPGILPEERAKIFDRGFTTAEAGTGFGLTIVQEIVDAHGGSIDVGDSSSGGARFGITGLTPAEDV